MTGWPAHVNHDEYSSGEAIELDCGTVIDAPNRLTLAWLVARHAFEEESGDWSKLTIRQKCGRLATSMEWLDKLDEEGAGG